MRVVVAILLCVVRVQAGPAAYLVPEPVPDDAATVAWIRFTDGPEKWEGIPYFWLGRTELHLTFEVSPKPGQSLELHWGSKYDVRSAAISINHHVVEARAGGYQGFRWVRVPIPEGLTGPRCQVVLKRAETNENSPAFLAEVRLTAPGGDPHRPALTQAAHKTTVTFRPVTQSQQTVEAFPEMRPIWDRDPPPLASPLEDERQEKLFRQAEKNARLANEALFRCRRYVDGWLAHADPATGLIPRNLRESRDFWNGRDAAADNYPFMVLTAALTDRPLFEGRMLDMLRAEQRLTSRLDRLPDDYVFSKQGWRREKLDLDAIIFDGAEYVKDGLVPLTEWLGPSPWSERMVGILEDIWKHAAIETPFGKIPTLNLEVNGDLLQAGSRLYWFTDDRKYLDWTLRLGDYFLLGTNHPTRDLKQLRLVDHGCEIVNGLTELYVAVTHALPEKKKAYEAPIHALFDTILAKGRNADGLLYSWFNPETGEHSKDLCDTWGYTYNGFYTLYLLDRAAPYRDAVRQALGNLHGKYVGACWGDQSADGFADSIEGAINLVHREPVESAAAWIDSQTRLMWAMQKSDGIIEGWHGDGNFARTSLLYALWKTQGVTVQPWRADVRLGAVQDGGTLHLSLLADQPWEGRVIFDRPRHRLFLRLPLDYPRINQFPEWFTVSPGVRCSVRSARTGAERKLTAEELWAGLPFRLDPGREVRLQVKPLSD
jgi:hypothetical protein